MDHQLSFETAKNMFPRDYGLEKTVGYDQKKTPYPRLSKVIDVETLRQRLIHQRNNELENNEDKHQARNMRMASVDLSDILALGASHTKQSQSSIESKKQSFHFRHITVPSKMSILSEHSSYSRHILSIGTPHPLKKIALNPKMLLSKLNVDPQKKVQVVLPKYSTMGKTNSNNSLQDSLARGDSFTGSNFLSFYERRRLFDMNEFNIAKNGKKLSEMPMPNEVYPPNMDDTFNGNDKQAIDEIISFLKIHGVKLATSKLISDSLWRSNTSMDSKDIFEDIKEYLPKEELNKLRNISFTK